ncbi:MAG: secretion/DNA translocation related TadE-like protein [Pontimonas sp.]|jgi:secretion/DNA translocation related TadE-like protein
MNSEIGSGTAWVLGFCGALLVATFGVMGVGSLAVADYALQGSVDRAALAGGDVLVGVVPGIPCRHARDVVEAEGFTLLSCTVVLGSIRVTGQASHAGVTWERNARAGVTNDGGE